MTAPGGDDHDDANTPPTGSPVPGQPDREAPWAPPPTGNPAPAYPPPGQAPEAQGGYQPGYPGDYPPPMPPPAMSPPPGFQQPPTYGGPPYPPAGYGPPPPGYSGGYYPPPDYPGGYGFQTARQPGTNGLAIASLVSSLAGVFCLVGSIAAIVLGTIAIDQIKRNRQDGYGLAVAGIVIGIAGLVVTLIVVIFAMNSR